MTGEGYDYFRYWTYQRSQRFKGVPYTRKKGRQEYMDLLDTYIRGKYNAVLDAGCGSGIYIRQFPSFCGVDINKNRLRHAKTGTVLRGDLLELPFRDKIFQASYTVQVLMHIPKILPTGEDGIEQVLRELIRVTRERLVHIELYRLIDQQERKLAPHCFSHNLEELYDDLGVRLIHSQRLVSYNTQVCQIFEVS